MRRGASHSSKRAKVDTPSKTYPAARRKLNEVLKGFSFVRVSEVTQVPPKDGKPEFFHCLGSTQSNSKYDSYSERVFLDKGGRLRYNATFDIGPCKLIDAAWGRDHISAIPQIGDIVLGILEANPKKSVSKQAAGKVLRSWSRHGKIIMELSRMVEFGTSMGEFETRAILRQSECAMAEHAMAALAPRGVASLQSSADDFWILARMILWGNLRPLVVLHSMQNSSAKCKMEASAAEIAACADIKISCSAYDFVSGLAFKLEDPDLLKDFAESFLAVVPAPYMPPMPAAAYSMNWIPPSAKTPEPSTPKYATSPAYHPSSPPPGASSPAYHPSSPPVNNLQSLIHALSSTKEEGEIASPTYMPSSPVGRPSSPPPPPLDAKEKLQDFSEI